MIHFRNGRAAIFGPVLALVAALVVIGALAGCGSSGSGTTTSSPATTEAPVTTAGPVTSAGPTTTAASPSTSEATTTTSSPAAKLDKLTLVAPPGPMAIPLAYIAVNNMLADVADETEVVIWENPDQLKAYVAGGQGDFVTMPSNSSAIFYNKGLKLQLLDISVWNITYLITRDPTAGSFADIKGQSLVVPFQGSVPDLMFQYMAKSQGLDPAKDFELRYATDPTQAAQLLVSGQVDNAVLSEALATAVVLQTAKGEKPLHRALAFDKAWRDASGGGDSPIAGTVATASMLDKPDVIAAFEREYKAAVAVDAGQPRRGRRAGGDAIAPARSQGRGHDRFAQEHHLEVHPGCRRPGEPGGLLSRSVGALAGGDRRQAARRWLLLQLHPLDRQGRAPGATACSTLSREWLPSWSGGSCSRSSSTRCSLRRPPTRSGPWADLAWGSTLWIQLLITLKRLVIGLAVGAAVGLGARARRRPRVAAARVPRAAPLGGHDHARRHPGRAGHVSGSGSATSP